MYVPQSGKSLILVHRTYASITRETVRVGCGCHVRFRMYVCNVQKEGRVDISEFKHVPIHLCID